MNLETILVGVEYQLAVGKSDQPSTGIRKERPNWLNRLKLLIWLNRGLLLQVNRLGNLKIIVLRNEFE